jgi:hypothetical protein
MKKIASLFSAMLFTAATFGQCGLFISEYVEGSSFNKAVELYNPTNLPINLNGYSLMQYNSGTTHQVYTFALDGIIASKGTYVIVGSQANATFKSKADTLTGNSVLAFNGDDPIILVKGTDTLDAVGKWGDNITDTLFLRNSSLVRKATISQGNKMWAVGATDWNVFGTDVESLGAHTMTATCPNPTDTTIQIIGNAVTVGESSGTYKITVALNQAVHASTISASVVFKSSSPAAATLADIGNFTTANITFAPNVAVVEVPVAITNDTLIEGVENFTFALRNISVNVTSTVDTLFTLSIAANDSVVAPPPGIPFYTIDKLKDYNVDGIADSLGVRCMTSGVVYGINTKKGSGFQFIIADHTGWIQVYSPVKDFGYSVNEGDSVVLQGKVDQYFGMTQMSYLDTLYKVGVNGLQTPLVLSTPMAEDNESQLIRINNCTLPTPSQWTNTAPGFTFTAAKGGTTYRVRIDSLTTAFGTQAPIGTFDVIGWVSQYDSCNPSCLSFYQLNPRYAADIIRFNSIDEVNNTSVAVYPNPTTGVFNLLVNLNSDNAEVKVYNLLGSLVYSGSKAIVNNTIKLNTDLANGSYIGYINAGDSKGKFKLEVIK